MPKLPVVSGGEAIRALERLDFVQDRQRGSHVILKKRTPADDVGCVVPLHSELAPGTLGGILKLAGVEIEDFKKYL
jgi:predicted RNA binding protein YcfA (HicA-like mRNA interferase family)